MRLDAERALIGLGYRLTEAKRAVGDVKDNNYGTLEELIRQALSGLSVKQL